MLAEVYDVGRLLDIKFDITAICSLSYMELFQHFNTSRIRSTLSCYQRGFLLHCCKVPHLYQEEALFLTNNDFD